MTEITVFVGLLVDSRHDWSLRTEVGVLVMQGPNIVCRERLERLQAVMERFGVKKGEEVKLTETQFLMPGLIDTHIHASQIPNAGLALDLTLLDWLEKYTFPTEEGLGDPALAKEVYTRCVKTTLASGTTSAVYFATIHKTSTAVLAAVCVEQGQRALVGKVCMDRNSPPGYCEDTKTSLSDARELVDLVTGLGSQLVQPVITPRFVPSCSRSLMMGLGHLAKEKGLQVQTHLSENIRECQWVKQLEPDCANYTQVYEKAGLLGPHTILAHCVHLEEEELETLRRTGAGVSHCPNSNFSLKSGICDVKKLKRAGVKVGLGTDCSGGYSPSMLNAMRLSVLASNTTSFGAPEDGKMSSQVEKSFQPLLYSDAVYLATRGGAGLLGRESELGSLEVGKLADLLLVDLAGHNVTRPFGHESNTDKVSKFVFLGDDRNILRVWVHGRKVKDISQTSV